jgi:hypothetical protein
VQEDVNGPEAKLIKFFADGCCNTQPDKKDEEKKLADFSCCCDFHIQLSAFAKIGFND